jgi:hypothetical protein
LQPEKDRKSVPLDSSVPCGDFTSCFFKFLTAPKYDIQRLGSTQRRAGVWAFFFIFFFIIKAWIRLSQPQKTGSPGLVIGRGCI